MENIILDPDDNHIVQTFLSGNVSFSNKTSTSVLNVIIEYLLAKKQFYNQLYSQ